MDFNSLVHDFKKGNKPPKVFRDSPRRAEHSKVEKRKLCKAGKGWEMKSRHIKAFIDAVFETV